LAGEGTGWPLPLFAGRAPLFFLLSLALLLAGRFLFVARHRLSLYLAKKKDKEKG
jgi:hypothetical protein